jgi:hypothetical protein
MGENVSSTVWWHDVPRGTMTEVRSYVRLDLPSDRRQGRPIDCSASFSNPIKEGPGADSEEKREPASDADTDQRMALKRLTQTAD